MLSAFPRDQQKCETNSDPQSEVTCDGTPCLENTCKTNSFARSAEVIVSYVGMKMLCFVNRQSTTNIAVNPEDPSNRNTMPDLPTNLEKTASLPRQNDNASSTTTFASSAVKKVTWPVNVLEPLLPLPRPKDAQQNRQKNNLK
jgi:hypothetical protein